MGGPGKICLQGAYHTMLPCDAPTTLTDLASVLEITTSDPRPTLWGNTVFFGKLRIGHAFACGFSPGGGWTQARVLWAEQTEPPIPPQFVL
jgi:hypothetical protein